MADLKESAHERCKDAVFSELAAMGATVNEPIDLYLVSPTQ